MSALTSLEVLKDVMDRSSIEASEVLGRWQIADVAEGCPTSDAAGLCFRTEDIKIGGVLTKQETKRQFLLAAFDLIVFRISNSQTANQPKFPLLSLAPFARTL